MEIHLGISGAKIIRDGARPQQGTRSGSSTQFTQNHTHCTRAWAVLMPMRTVRAKEGASRSKGEIPQAEANPDGSGEEQELEFPVSVALCGNQSCSSQNADVFSENADLLFSQEREEQGETRELFLRNLQLH